MRCEGSFHMTNPSFPPADRALWAVSRWGGPCSRGSVGGVGGGRLAAAAATEAVAVVGLPNV